MKEITIIGGGLAGLTLGILLRRNGVPVTVREAGTYPRHRVCGEFICGEGQEVLGSLGLALPARAGSKVIFFVAGRQSPVRRLPRPATCVSRHVLDAALAAEFQRLGGNLCLSARRAEGAVPEGMVLASGRRVETTTAGWRWFGLKVHARGAMLQADLEMHSTSQGYVGICRLPGDEVNVCGLFKRRVSQAGVGDWRVMLQGEPGSSLRQSLGNAQFEEASFCAVAGLSLAPHAPDPTVCRIGDALTMIPPVTGNGMSMAFESAALAVGELADYARGVSSWPEATTRIGSAFSRAFSVRLRWARWLHQLMFWRPAHPVLAGVVLNSPLVWRWFFAKTR